MKTDPRVDAYIARAGAFARPILLEFRKRMGLAVPDAEETIKWNAPFYLVKGKILASMAAFKAHTKLGLWSGMRPSFVDAKVVADLPPAKSFVADVKAKAALLAGGGSGYASHGTTPTQAPAAGTKKKTAAKTTSAPKKAPAKKTAAKKSPAKKTTATKASTKKSAVKKASKR
ncbi:MAG: DUF1801 domain-containing protein [Polyangiaceae bacterium]